MVRLAGSTSDMIIRSECRVSLNNPSVLIQETLTKLDHLNFIFQQILSNAFLAYLIHMKRTTAQCNYIGEKNINIQLAQ